MQINQIIEDLITSEIRELCSTCVHSHSCIYHQTSVKAIIQCELFELNREETTRESANSPAGLCSSCDHSEYCNLPGRRDGVWRCNEFR